MFLCRSKSLEVISVLIPSMRFMFLQKRGYEVDFVDILGSHAGLKEYLTLRETDALYKDICGTQRLGIPCMILEDGTKTLSLKDCLK